MVSRGHSVDNILAAVKDIPPLPAIVPRVMAVLNDPNSSVAELAKILGSDQAIASKLLRLSNSAFYGFSKHIGTIHDAVVLLGFKTIKGLIYALSLYSSFNQRVGGYKMDKGELWRHSLCAAYTAQSISTKTKLGNSEQAFVAGLMHDIGKTILGEFLTNGSEDFAKAAEDEEFFFVKAEQRILGISHPEIGAKVCEKWNLPAELLEAVKFHHNPSEFDGDNPLVPIVHLADAACLILGLGMGVDGLSYPFDDNALKKIGKDWKFFDDIVKEAHIKVADVDNILNM